MTNRELGDRRNYVLSTFLEFRLERARCHVINQVERTRAIAHGFDVTGSNESQRGDSCDGKGRKMHFESICFRFVEAQKGYGEKPILFIVDGRIMLHVEVEVTVYHYRIGNLIMTYSCRIHLLFV